LGEDVLSKALIDEIKLYSETPIIRRSALYTMVVDILADIPTASFDRVVQWIAHELGQTDAEILKNYPRLRAIYERERRILAIPFDDGENVLLGRKE
jgi:hypothetical protein